MSTTKPAAKKPAATKPAAKKPASTAPAAAATAPEVTAVDAQASIPEVTAVIPAPTDAGQHPMPRRRFPSPRDLMPLMKFKKPVLNGKTRRLANAYTIEDLRLVAKRRTPKAPFDYTDGAAEQEDDGCWKLERGRQHHTSRRPSIARCIVISSV